MTSRLVWWSRWLAWLALLVGVGLVVLGVLNATTWAPKDEIVGSFRGEPGTPVVEAVPGMLRLAGPRATVVATGTDADAPVFLGIGRAADVEEYLGTVAATQVVGLREDQLITRSRDGDASLPDPAVADIWITKATGKGTATLSWTDQPGEWRLVSATDGKLAAPESVAFTWSGEKRVSGAPAVISLGVLFVVAGLVSLALLWVKAREEAELQ